jgi:hypothetical protein
MAFVNLVFSIMNDFWHVPRSSYSSVTIDEHKVDCSAELSIHYIFPQVRRG